MENKVILSVYEKALDGMNIETVFDIVNLYGNKDIDGIELDCARHPEQIIRFKMDKKVSKYDMMRIKIK